MPRHSGPQLPCSTNHERCTEPASCPANAPGQKPIDHGSNFTKANCALIHQSLGHSKDDQTLTKQLYSASFANIAFKANAAKFHHAFILLVEGDHDEYFFVKHNFISNQILYNVKSFTTSDQCFKNNKAKFECNNFTEKSCLNPNFETGYNHKQFIINYVIYEQKNVSKQSKLYGLVDRDFGVDQETLNAANGHLFVTDTHDLETLLLKTTRFQYIRNLCYNEYHHELNVICYIAYQLGIVREAFNDHPTLNTYYNYGMVFKKKDVNYHALLDYTHKTYKLSLPNFVRMTHQGQLRSQREKQACVQELRTECPKLNDCFDQNGIFSQSLEEWTKQFEDQKSLPEDFWLIINGHEFFDLAHEFLHSPDSKDATYQLIDSYKRSRFKDTDVWKALSSVGLVNEHPVNVG